MFPNYINIMVARFFCNGKLEWIIKFIDFKLKFAVVLIKSIAEEEQKIEYHEFKLIIKHII